MRVARARRGGPDDRKTECRSEGAPIKGKEWRARMHNNIVTVCVLVSRKEK